MTVAARRFVGIITIGLVVLVLSTILLAWPAPFGSAVLFTASRKEARSPTTRVTDVEKEWNGESSPVLRAREPMSAAPSLRSVGGKNPAAQDGNRADTDKPVKRDSARSLAVAAVGPGESVLANDSIAAAALAIMEPSPPPTPPPPPSADEVALRGELTTLVQHYPGTELAYSVCEGNGQACRARIQAREQDALAKAARAAGDQLQGRASIDVHELTTAFNGRYFVADIEMGAAQAQGAKP